MTAVVEFEQVSKAFRVPHIGRQGMRQRLAGLLRPRGREELFWALRDLSFSMREGESLGLVGHNGSGKSTTLKLLTRILEPSSGRVRVQGRVAALLELGSGFHPELSGRENVFLYGSLMGFGRRAMAGRLDEIVAFAEMERFIDTEVKHYSSGMYARLAFAAATSIDPEILITDEVLSVGDEAFRRKCEERMLQFRREGKTIIYVSHGLESVRQLCERAIWLDHGVARAIGPTGEVIDAYLADVNRREQQLFDAQLGPVSSTQRRGTREVEILGVELLDPRGQARIVFQTNDPLTIRIRYQAHQRIERPVFGIALHHESGIWMSGPNSRFDDLPIPVVHGAGVVEYQIARLPLLAGRYQLSAAIYDDSMLHPFDYHDRMYRLVLQSEQVSERYGLLALSGSWSWRPTPESALAAMLPVEGAHE